MSKKQELVKAYLLARLNSDCESVEWTDVVVPDGAEKWSVEELELYITRLSGNNSGEK